MKFSKLSIVIIFAFGLIILTISAFIIWWNLPVTINRRKDISFGNSLINKIEQYQRLHGLPETTDWKTLKELGFIDKGDFFVPSYQKINDKTFEITYVEGFDGPYLLWNSKERHWNKAIPTIVDNTIEKILNLVEQQKIVKDQIKLIDSLSFGHRHITILPTLDDTLKNIFLARVGEDNGTNFVIYYNFLIDANRMVIINPTGKLEGQ